MRFYDVPVNQSVPTEANRGLISYIDGHDSHLTQDWFDYCKVQRIVFAHFPPHSTHML
jgi:hypothetical protein